MLSSSLAMVGSLEQRAAERSPQHPCLQPPLCPSWDKLFPGQSRECLYPHSLPDASDAPCFGKPHAVPSAWMQELE